VLVVGWILVALAWTAARAAAEAPDTIGHRREALVGMVGEPPGAAPAPSTDAPKLKFDPSDNAWVLTSSALVLFMTAPALALFYCGLVRKKNVLGVMMQCIYLMCIMTVIWVLYGYSLVFGGDGPWIGGSQYLCMQGAESVWQNGHLVDAPLVGTIPVKTHMLFQCMFFIITPALICGAFAERMKFSAMVAFTVLWGTLIYCPLAHWVWGNGILAYGSPHAAGYACGGALDFAGGTVIHVSSGVSALVCALLLGKRLGYGKEEMRPHNMTFTAIGAAMLWVGWFGFNAGSALAATPLATNAFAATHVAAATGGLAWATLEWRLRGKPSVLGVCSGIVAGLACITQAAGYVALMPALLIGAAGATACYCVCTRVKAHFGYDDSLDVFGVHGIAGTLGAILTGVFATRASGAISDAKLIDRPLGLLEGGALLRGQLVALAVAWGMALVGTFVILKVLDAVLGLRVPREAEIEGLDLSQHGEEGYIFF
jgi:Amt family ammonium transporter